VKTLLTCLLLLSFVPTAWPCKNLTGTKYGGKTSSSNDRRGTVSQLRQALLGATLSAGAHMEADLRGSTNFNDRSDYSVSLMYLGRSKEAVELLQQLEKETPGEYFIAANLGTAHELAGNNVEALRWINEGLRRNPGSHQGTEWLHAKILEAKIAHQADPKFFEKHSVLDLTPAQITSSPAIGSKSISPQQLAQDIQHQLEERLQFVKPPDSSVASLLFDYAAIEAATKSMESAKVILKMAAEYGYPEPKIQALLKDFDQRFFIENIKTYALYGVIGLMALCMFACLLFFLIQIEGRNSKLVIRR
jgi:tetratricopeptide (TPR) repeat protein